MQKKAKPRTYHAHRERQRRRILDAAQSLFIEQGIERITMAEITLASGLQPSTMYQYFSSKDDIAWELVSELLAGAAIQVKQRIEGAPNALAVITAFLEFMADELSGNQAAVRFLAEFDARYAHDWPVDRLLTLESQIAPQPFRFFTELIRSGIADGSLRADLDPELTMHAVMNAVIGAQRRLASLGRKVEIEYGQPVDRLFRETLRILLLGLRAPETPVTNSSNTRKRTARKRSS